MYIIVGLGNPTDKYFNTRHNIGFKTIDYLSKKYNINLYNSNFNALVGRGKINDNEVILVKPLIYMNSSGEAVKSIVNNFNINEKENLIVIYDDISLSLGQFRIRKKGSAGGHNGIKSIIELLGHDTFKRIKIGVGEKPKDLDLIDYVLGDFLLEEKNILDKNMEYIDESINLILDDKIDKAMSKYNSKVNIR